jgi:hypothetical protein
MHAQQLPAHTATATTAIELRQAQQQGSLGKARLQDRRAREEADRELLHSALQQRAAAAAAVAAEVAALRAGRRAAAAADAKVRAALREKLRAAAAARAVEGGEVDLSDVAAEVSSSVVMYIMYY